MKQKEEQNKALAEQMKKHGIPFIIEKQGAFFTAWIPAESLANQKIINKAADCLEALNRPVFNNEHKRLKRRRLVASGNRRLPIRFTYLILKYPFLKP